MIAISRAFSLLQLPAVLSASSAYHLCSLFSVCCLQYTVIMAISGLQTLVLVSLLVLVVLPAQVHAFGAGSMYHSID